MSDELIVLVLDSKRFKSIYDHLLKNDKKTGGEQTLFMAYVVAEAFCLQFRMINKRTGKDLEEIISYTKKCAVECAGLIFQD